MLLKLDEPKLFADSINIIGELVSEVKAVVNSEGLSITALDPANVALISLKMPKEVFAQFEVNGEQILGLNIDDLKQILRRTTGPLTIQKEEKENMLHLDVQNDQSKRKRSFSMALLSTDIEEKKRQELQFTTQAELPAAALTEAINDAAIISDACSFITTPDSFVIDAQGSLNRARIEFTAEEAKLQTVDAKAKYSLEYLQKFIKAGKLSSNVKISFSKDYPLQLDFKDKIELSFVLAPRVEEE